MNDGLKQRIVGALVLVALGVIFVPVIFDRERIAPVDRQTQIPPEPKNKVVPLPEPPVSPRPKSDALATNKIDGQFDVEDEVVGLAREKRASDQNLTDNLAAAGDEANTKLGPADTDSKLGAWVLQVASYESSERASETLQELEALKFRGFTRDIKTSEGTRTRLFVGPNVSKEALEKAKETIDSKFKVESIILKFRP